MDKEEQMRHANPGREYAVSPCQPICRYRKLRRVMCVFVPDFVFFYFSGEFITADEFLLVLET
jgi:hypothetical protein